MNGTNDFTTLNVDALAKIRHTRESGYPGFGKLLKYLDSRFHGNDVNRAHMQLAAGQLPAAIFNKLSRGTNAHEKYFLIILPPPFGLYNRAGPGYPSEKGPHPGQWRSTRIRKDGETNGNSAFTETAAGIPTLGATDAETAVTQGYDVGARNNLAGKNAWYY